MSSDLLDGSHSQIYLSDLVSSDISTRERPGQRNGSTSMIQYNFSIKDLPWCGDAKIVIVILLNFRRWSSVVEKRADHVKRFMY